MDREGQTTNGRAPAEQLGRVGIWTNQLDAQPAGQVREAIAELEELGWPSLWFWELFGREALTNAGLLLGATRQMTIASGIANIWARDPVAMAAAGRTLTEAHPGRFVLGIGVSHAPIVDARGHQYERPLDKMRGYLDAMDAAPGRVRPWPRSRPGCWPRSGPACWSWPRNGPPGRCSATGRRRRPSVLGPGPLLAVEQAALLEDDPAEGGSDRLVDAVVAWGGPEAVAERVRAHLDAGADHVCVQLVDPDPNGLPMAGWRTLAPALLER